MNKTTPKDILNLLVYCAVGLGTMLLLIHTLGELHGVILAVLLFNVQAGFLFMRVGSLERQLQAVQRSDAANIS
jgi:hypothetical protein